MRNNAIYLDPHTTIHLEDIQTPWLDSLIQETASAGSTMIVDLMNYLHEQDNKRRQEPDENTQVFEAIKVDEAEYGVVTCAHRLPLTATCEQCEAGYRTEFDVPDELIDKWVGNYHEGTPPPKTIRIKPYKPNILRRAWYHVTSFLKGN